MESRVCWLAALALVLAAPASAEKKDKKKADPYAGSRYKSKSMEAKSTYIFKAGEKQKYRVSSEDDDPEVRHEGTRKRKKKGEDDLSESRYKSKAAGGRSSYRFSEEGTPLSEDEPMSKPKKEKEVEDAPVAKAEGAPANPGPPPAALPAGGGKKAQLKPMAGGGLKGIGGGGLKGFGNAGGGGKSLKKIEPIAGGGPGAGGPGAGPPNAAGDATAQGQVAK